MDIALRGLLCSNDDADVLRFWGWRDVVAPMDIQAALDGAGGEAVTLVVNSTGGSMPVGVEIYSMLRRYPGPTEALIQGMGASAATLAACGCGRVVAEAGALLCYHNPSLSTDEDYRGHEKTAVELRNVRDACLNVYMTRTGKTREEVAALMDQDLLISPQQALEYGLIDEVAGLPGLEPEPVQFVAAAGVYPRVTAQMRQGYQDHAAAEAAAREEAAKRALARARALANY